jgi:hypothetical protein
MQDGSFNIIRMSLHVFSRLSARNLGIMLKAFNTSMTSLYLPRSHCISKRRSAHHLLSRSSELDQYSVHAERHVKSGAYQPRKSTITNLQQYGELHSLTVCS